MLTRLITKNIPPSLKNLRSLSRQHYSTKNQKDDITEEEDERTAQADEQLGIKQNRNTRAWWIYRVFVWTTMGGFAYHFYNLYMGERPKISREMDDQGKTKIIRTYNWKTVPGFLYMSEGIKYYLDLFIDSLTKPPVKKLLPDPFHPLFHPKTLVLNLSGTLVSSEYVVGKGRKLIIRPGAQKLLGKLCEKYEIIFWTDDDVQFIMDAIPRIKDADKVRAQFGRECFSWTMQEGLQRNLKVLNRDLSNVIVVDKNSDLSKNFMGNLIVVPQFNGDPNDNELQKLIPLLERMYPTEVRDVRKVIQKLGPDPLNKFNEVLTKAKQKQKQKEQGSGKGVFGKIWR